MAREATKKSISLQHLSFTRAGNPHIVQRIIRRPPMSNFFALLLSLPLLATVSSAHADDSNERFPNREIVYRGMQEIYVAMAKGTPPKLVNETQYFQGSCITPYSSVRNPQNYSAVLALSGNSEGKYSIGYGTINGGPTPSYTGADLAKLAILYSTKERAYQVVTTEHGGQLVEFTIAEATPNFPKIMAYLSVENDNPKRMHFVAALMGFYCKLDRVE